MRGMAREYAAGNSRGPGWREFEGTLGQLQAGRQAGSGMARSRAKARLNWVSQCQRWGRCRVMRPASAKNRRRRVLVVTVCSPRPMRAVQRARLWAITCTASQAPLAAKRPEGRWFSPTPSVGQSPSPAPTTPYASSPKPTIQPFRPKGTPSVGMANTITTSRPAMLQSSRSVS